MPKLLRTNFEPAEFIPVFEKLLHIESVWKLELPEVLFDCICRLQLFPRDGPSPIIKSSLGQICFLIGWWLLELLKSKDLVKIISKLLPLHIPSFIFASIVVQNKLELGLGQGNLGHVKAESKLVFSYISMSELIEILHELGHSDSFLLDLPPDPSQKVVKVLRDLVPDEALILFLFGLEIDKTVSIYFWNQFSILIVPINILDELIVINLIEIAPVHVFFQEQVELPVILRYEVKLLQDPDELVLCHISYFGYVEIFKQRLQMHSRVGNDSLVALQKLP